MKRRSGDSQILPNLSHTRALYSRQLPQLETALQSIYQEVRRLLERHGFTPTVKYRVKRFDTYFDKVRRLVRSGKSLQSKPIGDFLALRIICPFLEDIDTIERLLCSEFEVLESERKSAQHSFREFGYDSVHLAIRPNRKVFKSALPGVRNVCEIQLRTILQDAWAEVEHELVYKSDVSLPKESIRRKLAALNASLSLSDLIFQEIRDYQNELRQRGRKRRETLDSDFALPAGIDAATPLPDRPKPIASTLKSRLEKTMLRALEAHSNHDLDSAIELYGLILGMKLDSGIRSLVYNHRGMAWFSLGNYRQAIRDFSRAIDYDPTGDRSFANRGLCQRVLKRYPQAQADFREALRLNPNRPDTCFGLAQTLFDMRDFDAALKMCEKVLEISPGHKSARELIDSVRKNSV